MAISSISNSFNSYSMQTTMRALSSGKRINSAADDAAGLAISQKMEAQTAAMKQGVNNLKDGNNFIKVADGGMGSITNMVQDIARSYVYMNNGILSDQDKQAIQGHIDNTIAAINGVAQQTNFNGISVFSDQKINIQGGPSANDARSLQVGEMNLDLSSLEKTQESLQTLMSQRGTLGAQQNTIEHQISNNENSIIQTTDALSRIADADMAALITQYTQQSILERAKFSMQRKMQEQQKGVLALLK